MKNKVEVIILSYNNEKTIERCINSIKDSTYKNIKVVVMDSNSKDNTIKKAKSKNVSVIKLRKPSIPLAYNTAIKNSSSNYFMIINADSLISKEFIENAVKEFELNPEVGAITGLRIQKGNNFYSGLYSRRFKSTNKVGYISVLRGNYIIRTKLLKNLVKFIDEKIVASEEPYISMILRRHNYKIKRINFISMVHLPIESNFSFLNYVKKNIWYLKGKANVIKRLKSKEKLIFDKEIYLSLSIWLSFLLSLTNPIFLLFPLLIYFVNLMFYRNENIKITFIESLIAFLRQIIYPYFLIKH